MSNACLTLHSWRSRHVIVLRGPLYTFLIATDRLRPEEIEPGVG
jgi:hypothetical protein